MSEQLQPYADYQAINTIWIERIPTHWQVRSFGSMFKPRSERNRPDLPLLSVVRERGVLLRSSMKSDENHNYIPDDLSNYKVVSSGDLVINKMKAWQGSLGISNFDGVVSPAYFVFQHSVENSQYLHKLLRSRNYVAFFAQASDGVRIGQWDLSTSGMKRIPILVPPPDEQAAIVRYLNYMDRRIRRYIRTKQTLINLLNEQKQAIIQQAVTGGLNPDAPRKESGVEWLGEVPAHWEVMRSRYLFQEIDARSTTGEETHLSMSQKLGLVPSSMVEQRTLISESYIGGKVCEPQDLVLNRLKAHLGVFALAKQKGVISPDYSVFRKKAPISMEYFEQVLRSPACRFELRIRAKGIVEGFWRLYTDDFYDIRLPVPPLAEQEEIISQLDHLLDTVNRGIKQTQDEIDLMREYRTRLIADVVTGKLDVRTVAAQLPDEIDEPDLFDVLDETDEDEELSDLADEADEE